MCRDQTNSALTSRLYSEISIIIIIRGHIIRSTTFRPPYSSIAIYFARESRQRKPAKTACVRAADA